MLSNSLHLSGAEGTLSSCPPHPHGRISAHHDISLRPLPSPLQLTSPRRSTFPPHLSTALQLTSPLQLAHKPSGTTSLLIYDYPFHPASLPHFPAAPRRLTASLYLAATRRCTTSPPHVFASPRRATTSLHNSRSKCLGILFEDCSFAFTSIERFQWITNFEELHFYFSRGFWPGVYNSNNSRVCISPMTCCIYEIVATVYNAALFSYHFG